MCSVWIVSFKEVYAQNTLMKKGQAEESQPAPKNNHRHGAGLEVAHLLEP